MKMNQRSHLSIPVALVLVLSLAILFAAASQAYVLFGIKAQFHALTYYVNPNFNSTKDPNAGTTAQQLAVMQNGATDWNGVADFQFVYGGQTTVSTVNTGDGVNAIFYQDNTGDPIYGALAICFIFADIHGFVTGFDIEFYDSNGQSPFNDYQYYGLTGTPGATEFDIWSIATHEFGHAAGIDHTNVADPTITMYQYTSPADISHRVLASDDIAALIAIYGTGPYTPRFAGVTAGCPAPQNITRAAGPVTVNGFTITNTGTVADYFNYTITDAGAGVLIGDPITGQTPLLAPLQVYNIPSPQVMFGCAGGGPTPIFLTATSVGNPAATGGCSTIVTPTGGSFIPQTLINGQPTGIAWDAGNNLYVADFTNGQVLTWAAGAFNLPGAPVIGGVPGPLGIAFNPAGNLVVLQSDGAVSEWMIPGGAPLGLVAPPGSFVQPMDLAFCGQNMYVTDPGTGTFWCVPNGALGAGAAGAPVAVANGFADLFGVAVDQMGNMFVGGGVTGNLYMFPFAGGPPAIIGNVGGGGAAMGVALDVNGFIYVAEGLVGADIDVFPPGGGIPVATFPATTSGWTWMAFSQNQQVHGPGVSDTFLYTSNSGNVGPANCCTGAICTADVSTLGYANGELLPVNAPCPVPWPATVYVGSPPLSGSQPSGFAFDMFSGMLYSADFGTGTVDLTMPLGGGTGTLISGLQSPQGVAIGPDNFLYICEAGSRGTVSVYDPGGAYLHDLFAPSTFADPVDLAWCGPNLFITDRGAGTLYLQTSAINGPQTLGLVSYQTGFSDLFGVAVDPGGVLYVTTGTGGTVEIVNPGPNGGTTTFATLPNTAEGIACDMNGDLWVADGVTGDLFHLQAGSGTVLNQISGVVDGPAWVGWGLGAFNPGQPDSAVFWSNQSGENPVPHQGTGTIAYHQTGWDGWPEPPMGGPCIPTTAAEDIFAGSRVTRLLPAFPNPFNGAVSIAFYLEEEGAVTVQVFDVAGRRVSTLVDGVLPDGGHQLSWTGRDEAGRRAAPGIYFVRFSSDKGDEVSKLIKTR